MADGKKSFVLYCDLICQVQILSDTQAGELIMAILQYANGETPEITDRCVEIVFIPIKFDIDRQRYNHKDKHWNWKGGITPENKTVRNGTDIKIWRLAVFERDKFTCQKCFVVGGILHAHHKKAFSKYPELRFDVDNGLTLCKKCHNLIHKKNG